MDLSELLTNISPKSDEDVLIPDGPSCTFEGAKLRNASNKTVSRWIWGVSFRDNPQSPLVEQRGGIAPGQEDFHQYVVQRCAFRKVIGVEMTDGSTVSPRLSQCSDGSCYRVVGWIVFNQVTSSGAEELALLPEYDF